MKDKSQLQVLVSAIGGDVGQAIVKSLKLSKRKIACHGCDIEDNGIGKLFVDSFQVVPPATEQSYVKEIDGLCSDLCIDTFIPASEQEISFLSKFGNIQQLPNGIPFICQNASIIRTYGDKLRSMQALDKKINIALYADGKNIRAVSKLIQKTGYPVVVKERISRGSKSVHIANNTEELKTALLYCDLPLVQEYIDDDFGEYSIGIFSDDQQIQAIAFRRSLGLTGASWYAETCDDPDVLEYGKNIARIISPHGSINIQVRKSSKGVKLLEVNPRFSSLTAARAICGFNDVEWSLDLVLKGSVDIGRSSTRRVRFKRYISELIDFGNGFETIPEWMPEKQKYDKT
ncbi:MAG: ATP-grasp domain-containing protein [Methanoregula sp.]|nr:MAG: ATP-grasp domain-containing protein [Methanoregula sp.]